MTHTHGDPSDPQYMPLDTESGYAMDRHMETHHPEMAARPSWTAHDLHDDVHARMAGSWRKDVFNDRRKVARDN